jgi:nicotinamidase/pyrazinamidase
VVSEKHVFWEVDAQRDFMLPGGALYVPGAEKLLPNVDRLVDAARDGRVFLISDACMHPPDDPEFRQFPPHCIQGTDGAEIVPEALASDVLYIPNDSAFSLPADLMGHEQIVLVKQTLDVFDNPHTDAVVKQFPGETEFIVFGVVTEYCVRCAVRGLLHRGRKVAVVRDAVETLDSAAGQRTLDEFSEAGALLITTDEALARLSAG